MRDFKVRLENASRGQTLELLVSPSDCGFRPSVRLPSVHLGVPLLHSTRQELQLNSLFSAKLRPAKFGSPAVVERP